MKRLLCVTMVLILLVILSLATGCGSQTTTSPVPAQGENEGDPGQMNETISNNTEANKDVESSQTGDVARSNVDAFLREVSNGNLSSAKTYCYVQEESSYSESPSFITNYFKNVSDWTTYESMPYTSEDGMNFRLVEFHTTLSSGNTDRGYFFVAPSNNKIVFLGDYESDLEDISLPSLPPELIRELGGNPDS